MPVKTALSIKTQINTHHPLRTPGAVTVSDAEVPSGPPSIETLVDEPYDAPELGKRYVPLLPLVNPEKVPTSPPTVTVAWPNFRGNNTTRLPSFSDAGFQTVPCPADVISAPMLAAKSRLEPPVPEPPPWVVSNISAGSQFILAVSYTHLTLPTKA